MVEAITMSSVYCNKWKLSTALIFMYSHKLPVLVEGQSVNLSAI